MKVPNFTGTIVAGRLSLSRLQNEGSQRCQLYDSDISKSIKATE